MCSTLVGMIMPPPSTTAIQDKAQAALQQQQPLNQKHQVAGPPMTSVYSLGQRDLGKPQAPPPPPSTSQQKLNHNINH